MSIIHFLNVKEGDCIWVKHATGHNTIIDISNGKAEESIFESKFSSGNHNQKNHPVDPIAYFKERNLSTVFRFILTHPDMDHMDGIKALFDSFEVYNFWDTENTKVMDEKSDWGQYSREDWDFYQSIRTSQSSPKTLNLYDNQTGQYYNVGDDGKGGGDGLHILAPTKELVTEANKNEEYNDCSYVILYRTGNKKIVFAGDSAEKTWNHILENHKEDVRDVDILIAPHHGRKTGGNRDYLDTVNPKLTLFGNAKSEYLDYSSWYSRDLEYITNNQANCVILDTGGKNGIDVFVTYEKFAKKKNPKAYYDEAHKGWYIMTI